jgi:hypothetical protein
MSRLKPDPVDITNLLLREGGYPHLPEAPIELTPPAQHNKFKGTYKPDTKHSQAIERCKEDRGGEFSNISLSSKVGVYKNLK